MEPCRGVNFATARTVMRCTLDARRGVMPRSRAQLRCLPLRPRPCSCVLEPSLFEKWQSGADLKKDPRAPTVLEASRHATERHALERHDRGTAAIQRRFSEQDARALPTRDWHAHRPNSLDGAVCATVRCTLTDAIPPAKAHRRRRARRNTRRRENRNGTLRVDGACDTNCVRPSRNECVTATERSSPSRHARARSRMIIALINR